MHYDSKYFEINGPDTLFALNGTPQATKLLAIGYIAISGALLFARLSEYNRLDDPELKFNSIVSPIVQLIPSKIWKFPVSLILSNFIDVEVWKFIINFTNLIIGGSFIEQNWNDNSKELLKFVFVIGSVTNLVVVIVTILLGLITSHIQLDEPLDGNYTVLIGFPIIYKQLMPETTIFQLKNLGFLSKNFRFKLLPIFIMSYLTIFHLIKMHWIQLISIWINFFACWTYLRFFQMLRIGEQITVGDASDTFQLLYFFPDLVKPILKPIFDKTYSLVCYKLELIRPFQNDDIDKSNAIAEQRGAKKISGTLEERRKQLALQVLQERMV
ncbi:ZYRO0B06886p [Zygosaccharomyces rouxii]|uniref:ZYRO0B06886p n=1 Tax=Zygosaccharomyces rouxii (strain ATCC 2623 / CBS 732 / NBRC 1130 / NCYC 568 / NRRL Y-229) TaxID=559307 RepID=C5DRA7_ZYGRC|nr:uncharacterized protein ZYRO0B06886g [Zygosaccharomyces rouxii]KAH9200138.1 eukaryotic integral membrane protein-domain-containing protein [Zygosaccharomyces rouxii]CAR26318.1 ZYRO0B06886p [Zygosaccharomyces rouxii]